MTNENNLEAEENKEPKEEGNLKPALKIPNKRLCAYIIDFTVMYAPQFLLTRMLKIELPELFLAALVFTLLLLRDSMNGISPGKYVVGLQVVNSDGSPINYLGSIKRNLILDWPILVTALIPNLLIANAIGFVSLGIFLVEYGLVAYSKSGTRLGDRMANTKVIDLKPNRSDSLFLVLSILGLVGLYMIMAKTKPEATQPSVNDILNQQ